MSCEEDLESCYLAAERALDRGDTEEARRGFERVLCQAPGFAPAWDGLGSCRDAAGDLGGAGECFRKAIRLDRRSWRSYYNWGAALHRAGNLREACKWRRRACEIAPQERRLHHRLAVCNLDLGDYEEAL